MSWCSILAYKSLQLTITCSSCRLLSVQEASLLDSVESIPTEVLRSVMSTDTGLRTNKTGNECSSRHDSKRVHYVLRDVAHEKCHDGENDENLLGEQVSEMLTLEVLYPHVSTYIQKSKEAIQSSPRWASSEHPCLVLIQSKPEISQKLQCHPHAWRSLFVFGQRV